MRSPLRLGILALAIILTNGCEQAEDIPVGKGHAAQRICAGIFISGLERELVVEDYVAPEVATLPAIWDIEVDREAKTVSVADVVTGDKGANVSVYREGFGCTLAFDKTPAELRARAPERLPQHDLADAPPWPAGEGGVHPAKPQGVDMAAVRSAVADAFRETEASRSAGGRNTTSFAVAYRGKLIAERYAGGFDASTATVGWSMSKTIIGALIGILEGRGALAVEAPAPVPQWQGTPKAAITTEHLLRMNSGLEFYENATGENKDLGRLLYMHPDQAQYVLDKPLLNEPGSNFRYSTGQTLVLSHIMKRLVGGELAALNRFYQEALFHPADITSAGVQHDTTGTPGGSGVYMTPRDWARLGQLYLQDGVWQGRQVLPEGWVDYATTAGPHTPSYGAQLWLNSEGESLPPLPKGAYALYGHLQQWVIVVPSHQLVVVRTGYTFDPDTDNTGDVVGRILDALPD